MLCPQVTSCIEIKGKLFVVCLKSFRDIFLSFFLGQLGA